MDCVKLPKKLVTHDVLAGGEQLEHVFVVRGQEKTVDDLENYTCSVNSKACHISEAGYEN
jgi:hypothetical protein